MSDPLQGAGKASSEFTLSLTAAEYHDLPDACYAEGSVASGHPLADSQPLSPAVRRLKISNGVEEDDGGLSPLGSDFSDGPERCALAAAEALPAACALVPPSTAGLATPCPPHHHSHL